MRLLFIAAFCALLAGCGGHGGGGSSSPAPAPAPPRVPTAPPLFCYFGVVGRQLEETADHVDCVYSMDWGPWEDASREAIALRIVADLAEAKQRGIGKAIVGVGFLMFDSVFRYRGTADLVAFRARLLAAGLHEMVCAISLVDEPDMHGCSDPLMVTAFGAARAAWPEAKLAVIYGDHGTPGAEAADWIGMDAYPLAAGALARLPALHPGQRWLIVPGGADPWRNDPAPFVDFARTHDVAAIIAFMWGDRPLGADSGPGIRSNGMAAAYRAAAKELTSA